MDRQAQVVSADQVDQEAIKEQVEKVINGQRKEVDGEQGEEVNTDNAVFDLVNESAPILSFSSSEEHQSEIATLLEDQTALAQFGNYGIPDSLSAHSTLYDLQASNITGRQNVPAEQAGDMDPDFEVFRAMQIPSVPVHEVDTGTSATEKKSKRGNPCQGCRYSKKKVSPLFSRVLDMHPQY